MKALIVRGQGENCKETIVLAKLKYHGDNIYDLEDKKEYLCTYCFLPEDSSIFIINSECKQRSYSLLEPGFEYSVTKGGQWEIVDIYEVSFLESLEKYNIKISGLEKFINKKEEVEKKSEKNSDFVEFDMLPPGSVFFGGGKKYYILDILIDNLLGEEWYEKRAYKSIELNKFNNGNYKEEDVRYLCVDDVSEVVSLGEYDSNNIDYLIYPWKKEKNNTKL